MIYNPLFYSSALLWPHILLPPPQAAVKLSPRPLENSRDYTLTPEKDEHTDEEMPLNLSTKPSASINSASSTPTPNSRSNSVIWSPASMCELEKSSDNLPSDFSDNLENRNQFLKHYNQLKNLSLLQQSARQNDNLENGYFTQLQQQQQKFFEHVTAAKQVNAGMKNIFSVNNNNVILMGSDKDVARPDSTAHGDKSFRLQDGEQRRRERNFQVRDICILII